MAVIEWAKAEDAFIRYAPAEEFKDDHGNTNEQPALILASGAGGEMVIEGTKEELLALFSRCQQLVEHYL
jgi:hypothetical protein